MCKEETDEEEDDDQDNEDLLHDEGQYSWQKCSFTQISFALGSLFCSCQMAREITSALRIGWGQRHIYGCKME